MIYFVAGLITGGLIVWLIFRKIIIKLKADIKNITLKNNKVEERFIQLLKKAYRLHGDYKRLYLILKNLRFKYVDEIVHSKYLEQIREESKS